MRPQSINAFEGTIPTSGSSDPQCSELPLRRSRRAAVTTSPGGLASAAPAFGGSGGASTTFRLAASLGRFLGLAASTSGLAYGLYLLLTPAHGQSQPHISGLWLDKDGKAAIEVKGCGPEVCGNIVWLKDPLDPKGKPWTDILNPDKGKRMRPVCGMQIIGGLKPGAQGLWQDGWVYDPEEGKTFNLELSLQNQNTLKVFGFAGVRILSETMHWKRLPADSARCKA